MSIFFSQIKEAIEKGQHVCKLISMFLIDNTYFCVCSDLFSLIKPFFYFVPRKNIEELQSGNQGIRLNLSCALKNILAAYYNIIITYERYPLDIALNISLQIPLLISLLLVQNYRQVFS